jgi:hypothetical protein
LFVANIVIAITITITIVVIVVGFFVLAALIFVVTAIDGALS